MSTDSPRDGGGTPPDQEQASTRARGDLQRFKAMIETQGSESGAGSSMQTGATTSPRPISGTGASSWLPQMISMWEEPFAMMRRMSEELDRMVERFVGRPPGYTPAASLSQWTPHVDILQEGDQLLIAADLPGLRKDDINVEIRGDKLFIEGQRQESSQSSDQTSQISTRHSGRFYRMVALPPGIDTDSAQATLENGVLQVTLPMTSTQNRGRRLEIQQTQQPMPTLEVQPQQPQPTDQQAGELMHTPAPQPAQPGSQPSLH